MMICEKVTLQSFSTRIVYYKHLRSHFHVSFPPKMTPLRLEIYLVCLCRFLKVIIVSSFREEAARQKHVVGVHHDLATLFAELSQMLAGAPSNALLAGLLQQAAPRGMKTNVWARLGGQQGQLSL